VKFHANAALGKREDGARTARWRSGFVKNLSQSL
jgi:hypothetical protein